ncbi:unnamed protein product [Macrosiphum euphorbiae]|uniref:Uncharacterized protein n=1 Tax=Macrosiphum euphorbiae TaxID=13131 RepID=A0AAV0VM07_9HEMI|nr:unnamed protein product [Macrosiphum euphorbiae]
MKFYLQVRNQLKQNSNGKDQNVKIISEIVVTDVEKIWQKASIPIVSHIRALQLLINYHDQYKNIIKSIKNRKNTLTFKSNLEKFQNNAKDTPFLFSKKCIKKYRRKKEFTTIFRKIQIFQRGFYKSKTCIVKDAHGCLITKESNIVKEFRNRFKELLSTTNEDIHPEEYQEHTTYYSVQPELPEPEYEEITQIIKSLKNNKAPGRTISMRN